MITSGAITQVRFSVVRLDCVLSAREQSQGTATLSFDMSNSYLRRHEQLCNLAFK